MSDLTGKTIVITGASRGIGAATARYLADQGARIALAARSTDQITTLADEIVASGGQAFAMACDVSSPDYSSSCLICLAGMVQVSEIAYDFGV